MRHRSYLLFLSAFVLFIALPLRGQEATSQLINSLDSVAVEPEDDIGLVSWGNTPDNVEIEIIAVAPEDALAFPAQVEPNNVLVIRYDIGAWGGFTHVFTDGAGGVAQDWRAFNALQFWLYGNNTGELVQVEIFDNRNPNTTGDSSERWFHRIADDYVGWRQFIIPFAQFERRSDFQPAGAPNDGLGLDAVTGYAFGFPPGTGPQVAYLDDVRLVTASVPAPDIASNEPIQPTAIPDPAPDSALYRNGSLPAEARVMDLLSRMTLIEKIGQMTLVENFSIDPQGVQAHVIGGILSGGGGAPEDNTPAAWADMVHAYQDGALATRLSIPLIYGVDAVHGHNNVYGATIFPHNIGLGAGRNPALVRQIGQLVAQDLIATGIYWNYAPVMTPVADIRWGRTYESFGSETALVTELGLAMMQGMQGDALDAPTTVLATPKHFIADGGVAFGTGFNEYIVDQGDAIIDEATLREIYLPPYEAAIEAGALSIMASFSSWNGEKVHGSAYLLTDLLKGELGFEGFVVSDWAGIDQIDDDYYAAVVQSINAGVDMNMVPYDYLRFINTMMEAVENGDISMARIDDAVARILRVKFAMGLFERPYGTDTLAQLVGDDASRAVARQAVRESLVLLKNDGDVLPLRSDLDSLLVAGVGADDIGIQSGGWTISWQGDSGATTLGTTLLDGIEAAVSDETTVVYAADGIFENDIAAEVGIVVLSEMPYAEGIGDSQDLALPPEQLAMIDTMRDHANVVVVVLVTGRPMLITDHVDKAEAWVAAWLPGTEGAGVGDVLFGQAPFTGVLPHAWPASLDQLPLGAHASPASDAVEVLFPYGYGLTTD